MVNYHCNNHEFFSIVGPDKFNNENEISKSICETKPLIGKERKYEFCQSDNELNQPKKNKGITIYYSESALRDLECKEVGKNSIDTFKNNNILVPAYSTPSLNQAQKKKKPPLLNRKIIGKSLNNLNETKSTSKSKSKLNLKN
ncbi:hypothetical protein U3516DRAFT_656694 [Neocallimastix sp. 'constans']